MKIPTAYFSLVTLVVILAVSASAGNVQITGSGAGQSNGSPVCAPPCIFNNFDLGYGYNGGSGWTVGGSGSGVGLVMSAMDFTSTTSFTLSRIDVGIGWVGGFNGLTLSLETSTNPNGGGAPSDVILDSWNVTGLPTFSTCCGIETVFGNDSLLANTQYWIVASATPGHPDTWAAWNLNSTGGIGNMAQNSGSGWDVFSEESQGAFDVIGAVGSGAPEPSSFVLLGTGLLGVFGVVHRKMTR